MDTLNHKSNRVEKDVHASAAKMKESANDLLQESKKLASEIYQHGVETVSGTVGVAEDSVHEYSDKIIAKIQKNPISSILIAAGVGVLLSSFLKK